MKRDQVDTMFIGDWMVEAVLDEDGRLGVYVSNSDESGVGTCNAIIGETHEWAELLTTEAIERKLK